MSGPLGLVAVLLMAAGQATPPMVVPSESWAALSPAERGRVFEALAERPLRSLTAELCGPVMPGPATISVEPLRRGSGVTTLAARLEQGGEVLAHVVGVFGRPREELTLRLSYVNFNGAGALTAAESGEPVDANFIRRHCPDTLEAIRRIADWAAG